MKFLIISGMSGAGKSRAMAVFEDLGFYCVDNMPVSLIPKFAELCMVTTDKYENVAIVTDVRGGGDKDFNELFSALDSIVNTGFDYSVLFLDASTDVLINRYKETRRKHPLDSMGIKEALDKERTILETVRDRADYIIDTTILTPSKLREHLINIFSVSGTVRAIVINVISFGFKYGIPIESDLLFDVRFLPNPFYDVNLKSKTGMEKDVRDYVFKSGKAEEFLRKLYNMIDFLIPQYIGEGKTSLVISIGCTGGKHRSVAIAEEVATYLKHQGYHTILNHRDYLRG
ncbi:MAG: RNase adapter RapZ [Clostridiales bacterium]|nr:RNase adapter RapZ [Clostridiales bacterium]